MDAAAVEAALSLCEENGHALPAGWDSGPFQPRESQDAETAAALQPSSLYCSMEAGSEASLICNSKNNCLAGFPLELRSPPPVPLSSCNSKTLERCQSSPSMHSEAQTPQRRDTKEPAPEDSTVKCESYSEAPENNDRGTRNQLRNIYIYFKSNCFLINFLLSLDSKKEDSPSVKGQQKVSHYTMEKIDTKTSFVVLYGRVCSFRAVLQCDVCINLLCFSSIHRRQRIERMLEMRKTLQRLKQRAVWRSQRYVEKRRVMGLRGSCQNQMGTWSYNLQLVRVRMDAASTLRPHLCSSTQSQTPSPAAPLRHSCE